MLTIIEGMIQKCELQLCKNNTIVNGRATEEDMLVRVNYNIEVCQKVEGKFNFNYLYFIHLKILF